MRRFFLSIIISAAIGAAPAAATVQTPQTPPQKPPQAAPPQATPPPAASFPEGAKTAYINPQRILAESALGKAATARISALRTQKQSELAAKNKELETTQQKLASGSLLSQDAAAAAQKSVDRLQIEIQRAQQDAEAALLELQQQLNMDFDRALAPIVAQVAREKGIQVLLRIDAGAVAWADPALDLTGEIVKRLDAAKPATPVKPPAAPQVSLHRP